MQLRRFGHISEGTTGNIAASHRGHMQQARTGAYLQHNPDTVNAYQQAAEKSRGAIGSFFGNAGSTGSPSSDLYWEGLVPSAPRGSFRSLAGK